MKTHVGTNARPCRLRSPEMRANRSTIGATDGSIIAPIIVTQIPRYHPSPPRSVPGPASIPRIRSTVTAHAATAPAPSTIVVRLRAMRCSVILASFPCSSPLDVPEDENSSPRDGYERGRLGPASAQGLQRDSDETDYGSAPETDSIAFPRYCAAVSASCGSRTVAMIFRVAAGLIS